MWTKRQTIDIMDTTNFKDGIIASNGFIVSKTDTPTRVGSRIQTLGEMAHIPNPAVGMIVYVRSTDEYYSIKSLKAKNLGGHLVENAEVDTYDKLFKSEIEWHDVP